MRAEVRAPEDGGRGLGRDAARGLASSGDSDADRCSAWVRRRARRRAPERGPELAPQVVGAARRLLVAEEHVVRTPTSQTMRRSSRTSPSARYISQAPCVVFWVWIAPSSAFSFSQSSLRARRSPRTADPSRSAAPSVPPRGNSGAVGGRRPWPRRSARAARSRRGRARPCAGACRGDTVGGPGQPDARDEGYVGARREPVLHPAEHRGGGPRDDQEGHEDVERDEEPVPSVSPCRPRREQRGGATPCEPCAEARAPARAAAPPRTRTPRGT